MLCLLQSFRNQQQQSPVKVGAPGAELVGEDVGDSVLERARLRVVAVLGGADESVALLLVAALL